MAGDWYDLANGGEFSIAGWQGDTGPFNDVEGKDDRAFEDTDLDPGDLEIVVFHYKDDGGNDLYYTLYGPFEDYDGMAELIDDVLDRYGVE